MASRLATYIGSRTGNGVQITAARNVQPAAWMAMPVPPACRDRTPIQVTSAMKTAQHA